MTAHVMGDGRIISREILTAATTTWISPAVDGNNDGGYILRGQIRNGVGSNIDIAPLINNVGSGLAKVRIIGTGSAASSDANHSGSLASLYMDFWFTMPAAETGADRCMYGWTLTHTSAGISELTTLAYKYNDTSTNITEFRLQATIASGIGAGSKIILERTF